MAADRTEPVVVPPELAAALARTTKTDNAFAVLTRGKQREYTDYLAAAKRAETKATRLAKIVPMIEAGVGLNDKDRAP